MPKRLKIVLKRLRRRNRRLRRKMRSLKQVNATLIETTASIPVKQEEKLGTTQIRVSFITSDVSENTYTYTITSPATNPTFDFPSSYLSLSQSTFQRLTTNGTTLSIALSNIQLCNVDYSSCTPAGSISNGVLSITNATLQTAAANGHIGFTQSSSDSTTLIPIFYFKGTSSDNSTTYKYAVNYPSASGNLSCIDITDGKGCKQKATTLSTVITLAPP